jgi:hypothetical protein
MRKSEKGRLREERSSFDERRLGELPQDVLHQNSRYQIVSSLKQSLSAVQIVSHLAQAIALLVHNRWLPHGHR